MNRGTGSPGDVIAVDTVLAGNVEPCETGLTTDSISLDPERGLNVWRANAFTADPACIRL